MYHERASSSDSNVLPRYTIGVLVVVLSSVLQIFDSEYSVRVLCGRETKRIDTSAWLHGIEHESILGGVKEMVRTNTSFVEEFVCLIANRAFGMTEIGEKTC